MTYQDIFLWMEPPLLGVLSVWTWENNGHWLIQNITAILLLNSGWNVEKYLSLKVGLKLPNHVFHDWISSTICWTKKRLVPLAAHALDLWQKLDKAVKHRYLPVSMDMYRATLFTRMTQIVTTASRYIYRKKVRKKEKLIIIQTA